MLLPTKSSTTGLPALIVALPQSARPVKVTEAGGRRAEARGQRGDHSAARVLPDPLHRRCEGCRGEVDRQLPVHGGGARRGDGRLDVPVGAAVGVGTEGHLARRPGDRVARRVGDDAAAPSWSTRSRSRPPPRTTRSFVHAAEVVPDRGGPGDGREQQEGRRRRARASGEPGRAAGIRSRERRGAVGLDLPRAAVAGGAARAHRERGGVGAGRRRGPAQAPSAVAAVVPCWLRICTVPSVLATNRHRKFADTVVPAGQAIR